MTNKTNLTNLVEQIQVLPKQERHYWTFQLAVCHDYAHHGLSNLGYWQNAERSRREKQSLVFALSRILTGRKEDPQIKNGVEAFISLSKNESEALYKTILGEEEPKKITKNASSNSDKIRRNQGHERN